MRDTQVLLGHDLAATGCSRWAESSWIPKTLTPLAGSNAFRVLEETQAHAPASAAPGPSLQEADAELVMDLSVRLKFGDATTSRAACRDFRNLVWDLPPDVLIAHGPLMDGLMHATRACMDLENLEALCALFARLLAHCLLPFAGFRIDLLGLEETLAATVARDPGRLPASAPLHLLLMHLLRDGLKRPVGLGLVHLAFRLLRPLCAAGPDRQPFGCFDAGQRACHLRLAASALNAHLASARCEVTSLPQAFLWFSCVAPISIASAGCPWDEPLWTHHWTLNTLALLDIFVDLLRPVGAAGIRDAMLESADLANTVRSLLFDYRLLFERPDVASDLLACATDALPGDAADFRYFCELVGTACREQTADEASDAINAIEHLHSRLQEVNHQLKLLALADDTMHCQNVVSDIVGLVVEVAQHCRSSAEHLHGHSDEHEQQQGQLSRVKDKTVEVCSQMGVCPVRKMQERFYSAIEAEPEAAWLFCRPDFVVDCLCHGGQLAERSIVRWRQGDCAAPSESDCLVGQLPSPVLLEFVELACQELAPSSLAAGARRLFAKDPRAREEAALATWRRESARLAALPPAEVAQLSFLTDPVGSICEQMRQTLNGYHVQGLQASAQDLDHLCRIVGNHRLAWGVRSTALVQLATIAVSDPNRALALLAEDTSGAPAMLLELFRATALTEEDDHGAAAARGSSVEFYTRLCHACSALLLVHRPRSIPDPGTVPSRLRGHRDALLGKLLPLVFHSSLRLRGAVIQLAACLLFDPALTLLGAAGGKNDQDEAQSVLCAGSPSLRVPAWLDKGYVLPLRQQLVSVTWSPATAFWGKPLRGPAFALCQIFHRLHAALGFHPALARLFPRVGACSACEESTCVGGAALSSVQLFDGIRPRDTQAVSVVWRRVEELLTEAMTMEERLEVLRPLALIPPVGMWLIRNQSYLSHMLGRITRPAASAAITPAGRRTVVLSGSSMAPYAELLEHALRVLRALPADGEGSRRPVEQLAEGISMHILPAVWDFLSSGDEEFDLQETVEQHVHGLLATCEHARSVIELLLRVAIAIGRRAEICAQWLWSSDWIRLLEFLISSSFHALRRYAFATAVLLAPCIIQSSRDFSSCFPTAAQQRSSFAASRCKLQAPTASRAQEGSGHDASFAKLALAVFKYLGAPMANGVSMQHSFELKAALWLMAHALIKDNGVLGGRSAGDGMDVTACLAPWLEHKGVVIRALAWRASRACLTGRDDRSRCSASCMSEIAAVARVCRGLRTCSSLKDAEDPLAYAEMLELLRRCLVGAKEGEAYVKEILDAGILANGLLPACLQSGHCGLQRSVVRLLSAMVSADHAVAGSALLRSGLWPQIAVTTSALSGYLSACHGHEAACNERLGHMLDAAALMGDVMALVVEVSAPDPQTLLWLASSSSILGQWEAVMAEIVKATDSLARLAGVRFARLLGSHIRLLASIAEIVKSQFCTTDTPEPPACDWEHWDLVINTLHSPAAIAMLAEGLREHPGACSHSSPPWRAAATALTTLCGLRLLPDSRLASAPFPLEDLLGKRSCELLKWAVAQPCASSPTLATAGAGASESLFHQPIFIAQYCLMNLFHASPGAAAAAWHAGLLIVLVNHIEDLQDSRPVDPSQRVPLDAMPHGPQRLVGAIRLLAALLTSAGSLALADAIDGSHRRTGDSPLAVVLLSVRASAERDTTICLELVDLLARCAQAVACTDTALPSLLLRLEFIPWLMRLSQRRQLPSALYCRVMGVLSLCAPALTGKPILIRYLAHVAERIGAVCRGGPLREELRCRKALAMLHFVASMQLCPRCTALLTSPVSPAHASRSHGSAGSDHNAAPLAGGTLGMDFWLDLVEPEGRMRAPANVRAAALRVLLAIATGSSQHAKTYFVSSARALPLLHRLLLTPGGASANGGVDQWGLAPIGNGSRSTVERVSPTASSCAISVLALNILWVVAHGHQRSLPVLRKLRATETLRELAALRMAVVRAPSPGGANQEKDDYTAVMIGQLMMILG